MSSFSEKMSFVERVQNFVLKLGITIGTQVHFYSESCFSLEIASVNASVNILAGENCVPSI